MTERDPVFDDLKAMYEVLDPPPPHLVDAMIAAVAAEDLDADYELLTLVSRQTELAGTRGAAPLTIEFSYEDVTVLLRVVDGSEGVRRLDGWITPAADGTVRVVRDGRELTTDLTAGRFEIAEVPSGLVRIWFDIDGRDELATPTFEI